MVARFPPLRCPFATGQAREVAKEATDMWKALLDDMKDDDQRGELQRSMGMKMEQLVIESEELFQMLIDH